MVVHSAKYDSSKITAREIRKEELPKLQAELPNNVNLLKLFIGDVVGQQATFMERCKEVIKTLIEDKHIAHHKMKLIEHAAGLGGKDASNWMDQLQYLVDENEKLTASLGEYKKRLKEMNHQAQEQYDYWLNYCSYLASGYELERTGVYEQLSRTQNELVDFQTKWIDDKTEFERLKIEAASLRHSKGKLETTNVNDAIITELKKELAEAKRSTAQQRMDKDNLETRVKIMEEARSRADEEVSKLRVENNQLRLNMEDPSITELKEKIARQEELDEQQNLIMFVAGGESGSKQIKAIMPQKLLDRLTDQTILVSNDEAMVRMFLTVHKLLPIDSNQVLSRFMHRIESCKDLKDVEVKLQQQISLRVCNILKMWVDELWDDFKGDPALMTRIVMFVDNLKENKYSNLLRPIVEKKLRPQLEEKPANIVIPKPILPKQLANKRFSSVAGNGTAMAVASSGLMPQLELPNPSGQLNSASANATTGNIGSSGAAPPALAVMQGKEANGSNSNLLGKDGVAKGKNGNGSSGSALMELLNLELAKQGINPNLAKLQSDAFGASGGVSNAGVLPLTAINGNIISNAVSAAASTGTNQPQRPPQAPSVEAAINLKFTDVDPVEFARQLTLIEFGLYKALKSHEFLDVAWMKEDKRKRASNICRFTDWSNHVIKWIITEVVTVRQDVKARAAVFERCVAIASSLHELKNFNGLKEVLAALDSSPIFRLKKTRESVSDQTIKEFENLKKLVSHDMNSKMLRGKVRESIPPLIPFPGITQSDLVFLDSCGKNKMDNGMFNFQKYLKMVGYIIELLSYQRHKYWLEPVMEIQNYIINMEVMNDDEAYNASLQCESRN